MSAPYPRRRRRRRRGNRSGGDRQQFGVGQNGGRGPRGYQHQGQNGRARFRDRDSNRYGDQVREGDEGAGAPIIGTSEGVLELHPKGYGFLRDPKNNYAAVKTDTFVPGAMIEKFRLREGVLIRGEISAGTKGNGPRLRTIENVDGRTVEEYQKVKHFDELTAINPFEHIKLETGPQPITMRVMDLLTPIGKGQRALIVAPPRTGKTMLLQEMANAVSINHPEMHLIVLLIDERPEEVTEMRRRVHGEVIASSMDRDVESHVRISQLIIERGKRIAEAGGEVFILLDSITRTARAFNKWVGNARGGGRTMSGGLDVKALDIPKKLFGTARRFDEGGSLTVVATALIDTGSRMDEVIFQEFKGTGNMEMVLNRQLADRRIWPSIDITLSGTRREEKILPAETLDGVTLLRRSLVSLNPVEAMEQLIKTLSKFPTNKDFLAKVRAIL
jgi:transcription termination factor Rho